MKAVIYVRTANTGPDAERALRVQQDIAERYCTQHGIVIDAFYVDRGVSGATAVAERPKGARMLNDARAGAFDLVLVHSLDRICRDPRILQSIRNDLESLGISIATATEPFDPGQLEGSV